ncbi:MAG: hypothetical protein LAT77_10665 [Aliidiomarina sp.]|uniref:capsular polysaccharide export protein, LipB/KpsS family n=1 Tax=Aliidiomarina sp. TaxID=1872439 RepID=UPI0025BD33B8|nr:hypothetical protein [Aliidiomarina sp.]MCH8502357.1 hypothetical protein [Aliidiomarina sp.]
MTPWAHAQAPELRGLVYAIGFKSYWRPVLTQFLPSQAQIQYVDGIEAVPEQSTAVIWGRAAEAREEAERRNITLFHLEDGFLRSVGLGAEFVKPLSWVIDRRGLYFDATRASDLEHLLNTGEFSQHELQEAGRLIQKLNELKISKYNTGKHDWQPRGEASSRKRILVPGQVESDASIQYGAAVEEDAPAIRRNIELLKAVRSANPEAYVIYKPHPDVLAKAREAGAGEAQASAYCDEIVGPVSLTHMLEQIDEVHVLTSLSGFEALLRGIPVTCYGLPFYAGWGLTKDLQTCARRTASRTLPELVAAALMRYPIYSAAHSNECAIDSSECKHNSDECSDRFVTAEVAVNYLQLQRDQRLGGVQKLRHKLSQKARNLLRRVLNHWRRKANN